MPKVLAAGFTRLAQPLPSGFAALPQCLTCDRRPRRDSWNDHSCPLCRARIFATGASYQILMSVGLTCWSPGLHSSIVTQVRKP